MFADLEQEVFNLIDLYRCIEIQSEVLAELSDKLQEESSLVSGSGYQIRIDSNSFV